LGAEDAWDCWVLGCWGGGVVVSVGASLTSSFRVWDLGGFVAGGVIMMGLWVCGGKGLSGFVAGGGSPAWVR
jgi:hypothetical protein